MFVEFPRALRLKLSVGVLPKGRALLKWSAVLGLSCLLMLSGIGCSFSGGSRGVRSARSGPSRAPARSYTHFQNGGELSWPVAYGRVASAFGPRDSSFHDGLDIASDEGLPVRAAHSGKVVYAGNRLSGYGNLVILRHQSGLLTIYAHNSRLNVEVGDKVYRGAIIALLGHTGHASGPHVHFEVRLKDRLGRYVAVDPMPLLGPAGGKPRFRVNESLTPLFAGLWP